MAWDTNNKNDWSNASLQKYLNGEYYNNLNDSAKNMIGNTKWYLGAKGSFERTAATHYYDERMNAGYRSYVSNIGLMYPSDYGFATSGDCLNLYLSENSLNDYSQDKCKSNNWLYLNLNIYEWTISPYRDAGYANNIKPEGNLNAGHKSSMAEVKESKAIRSSVYLKSGVTLANDIGTGTKDNPYMLSLQ